MLNTLDGIKAICFKYSFFLQNDLSLELLLNSRRWKLFFLLRLESNSKKASLTRVNKKHEESNLCSFKNVPLKSYSLIKLVNTLVIPVSEYKKILNTIFILMFSLSIGIVILLFFSGRFLAKKTLSPVEQIRKQVDTIYEKNLSSRIISPNPNDEIGQLSNTFNRLLQRLEKAFDAQQQFIADASHELKTPIAILRSQWEKLATQQELPYEYRVRIQSDLEELARLSNLINILLLLAAPKEDFFVEDFPKINLSELVYSLYDDLQILAESKKQHVSFSIDENIHIAGDKSRVYQLLLNLADNAVKYTLENGIIEIKLKTNNNFTEFSIKDNGIGISEEHLPHVFERFYRVDKSRSRKNGGFGLGLAVCKIIVESHKGSINIQSDNKTGTTVVVQFPLVFQTA